MSDYTMTLKRVIDIYGKDEVESWFSNYDLHYFLTGDQIEAITNSNIWNKEFLAEMIVQHYLTREIAFETPFLFKQKANIKMIEIMEKYAPFIYAKAIQTTFDPLTQNMTFSLTESYKKENSESNSSSSSSSGSSSSSSSDSSSGLNVSSNTPQRTDFKSRNFTRKICFRNFCK